MAGKLIPMSQLKQLLRLIHQGQSIKGIARDTGISKNTVKVYQGLLHERGINLEEALGWEDPYLEQMLRSPVQKEKLRHDDFLSRLSYFQKELAHSHMTRQLLWEEYKQENPQGYQYSQFCHYLQLYDRKSKATLVIQHLPADKLFIDFSGDKLHYIDRSTGEVVFCPVFVATLGHSNYSFHIATHSQSTEDVIQATVCALEDIGGSPRVIVPDNLKAAVVQSNRYEPRINEAFLDMANHYQMVVLPTRARKPKDKAKVERAVQISYQRVFARIRKRTFYSLQELNQAIAEQSLLLNQRPMQQLGRSRQQLLEMEERPLLKALPEHPYELRHHLTLTLQQNCHVYLSRNKTYFSAPYRLIGNKVQVIITSSLVRIYHQGECVATHNAKTRLKYNSQKEHLPSHHQIVLDGLNEESIKERAARIGESVLEVVKKILLSSKHPEQAFNACKGIFALEKKVTKDVLVESCVVALKYNVCTYRNIERLATGRYANRSYLDENQSKPLPPNPNVRGADNYI
jgi:transposase